MASALRAVHAEAGHTGLLWARTVDRTWPTPGGRLELEPLRILEVG
ncbi:hypothetical protein [Actinomadura sp. NTSP31]